MRNQAPFELLFAAAAAVVTVTAAMIFENSSSFCFQSGGSAVLRELSLHMSGIRKGRGAEECPAPVCYPTVMVSFLLFSIFDLNSRGVKYPKLECGLSVL